MGTSALGNPSVALNITGTLTGGADPAPASSSIAHYASFKPPIGTAAGQANQLYSAALAVVASGTPLLLDMTSLTDSLGNAVNFAHVLAILISNGSTTAGQDITVGGASSNPLLASESDPVQANGGAFCVIAPNPGFVVDSTHKVLQIGVVAGSNVPVKVTILGRST